MGRLSDRDVDALVQAQYEDALADDVPWANEAFSVRQWMALNGKTVTVEFDDGMTATGVWEWRGETAPDWYLVYIRSPEGWVIVGTDVRNFTKITAQSGRSVEP